jgi:hypothetical protein
MGECHHAPPSERMLQNFFNAANITLILKTDTDIARRENYRQLTVMNTDPKILNEN